MATSADPAPVAPRLRDLAGEPGLRRVLLEHGQRGVRIQVLLRVGLVAFAVLG